MSMICQDLRMWQKFRNTTNQKCTRLKEIYKFRYIQLRESMYGVPFGSFCGHVVGMLWTCCGHVAFGPLSGLYKIEPSDYGSTYKIPVCYTQQATYLYFDYPGSNPQSTIERVRFTYVQTDMFKTYECLSKEI